MRIYQDLEEARTELMRDLKEMGHPLKTGSYQNKLVADDDTDYHTVELLHYNYMIVDGTTCVPKPEDEAWAIAEWRDRSDPQRQFHNPGEAYKLRAEYWTQFLNKNGEFDYTYGERIDNQLLECSLAFERDPYTRRAVVSIWEAGEDIPSAFKFRVPCSIYYHFLFRDNRLYVDYHQRSCDLIEHWQNDLHFACRMANYLQNSVRTALDKEVPYPHADLDTVHRLTRAPISVIHRLGSLHAYNKDLKGVF